MQIQQYASNNDDYIQLNDHHVEKLTKSLMLLMMTILLHATADSRIALSLMPTLRLYARVPLLMFIGLWEATKTAGDQ